MKAWLLALIGASALWDATSTHHVLTSGGYETNSLLRPFAHSIAEQTAAMMVADTSILLITPRRYRIGVGVTEALVHGVYARNNQRLVLSLSVPVGR
jgi:hypothetical protein